MNNKWALRSAPLLHENGCTTLLKEVLEYHKLGELAQHVDSCDVQQLEVIRQLALRERMVAGGTTSKGGKGGGGGATTAPEYMMPEQCMEIITHGDAHLHQLLSSKGCCGLLRGLVQAVSHLLSTRPKHAT